MIVMFGPWGPPEVVKKSFRCTATAHGQKLPGKDGTSNIRLHGVRWASLDNVMKIILPSLTFISGGFLAYGIGVLIYRLRRGPSLLVGATPIILAFVLMAVSQSGGYIGDMSVFQAGTAGLSLGMASIGAFLFWSQKTWGP